MKQKRFETNKGKRCARRFFGIDLLNIYVPDQQNRVAFRKSQKSAKSLHPSAQYLNIVQYSTVLELRFLVKASTINPHDVSHTSANRCSSYYNSVILPEMVFPTNLV